VLPELADRVRRAKPLLLVALADRKRATEPSSNSVNRSPADGRACDGEAAWWRREFLVRTIARELTGARSRPKAEQLAFEDLVAKWHHRNGVRVDDWQCAGCDGPIGGLCALALADGNRVHFETSDCLLRYGDRWRGVATRALFAIGLKPPVGAP
jgi:hypothetical protein